MDDTKIYCFYQELREVTLRLDNDTVELRNWFVENFVTLTKEKCHLLIFGEKDTGISINVVPSVIKESNEEKLLDVIIDRKLKFKHHLNIVCRKASLKLHACKGLNVYAHRRN